MNFLRFLTKFNNFAKPSITYIKTIRRWQSTIRITSPKWNSKSTFFCTFYFINYEFQLLVKFYRSEEKGSLVWRSKVLLHFDVLIFISNHFIFMLALFWSHRYIFFHYKQLLSSAFITSVIIKVSFGLNKRWVGSLCRFHILLSKTLGNG